MTTKEYKKIEQLAKDALKTASHLQKIQAELRVALSVADIKAGRVKRYKNVRELFKDLGLV